MLFDINSRTKKLSRLIAFGISLYTLNCSTYAINDTDTLNRLTKQEVAFMIEKSQLNDGFQITAAPEVVTQLNNIRLHPKTRAMMAAGLARMQQYKAEIHAQLATNKLPNDLMVLPLIESGYQPLDQSENRVSAAGIWQIIPTTAKNYGLVVSNQRDDRLNTKLSTRAALGLLAHNFKKYHSWKLALIAYEYGDNLTDELIKKVGSNDAWKIARSHYAPNELKSYLSMLDASVIIMHNPSLVADHT